MITGIRPYARYQRNDITAQWRASPRFQSFLSPQIDGARDADADRSRVCGEPVVLTTTSSSYLPQLRPSMFSWTAPSHPCPAPAARSRSFDPAAVRICCSFATSCGSLCGFGCLHVKGQRQKGGARSWWASFRAHRDRDDGGQDADQGGAEQHQRNFCGSGTDLYATEPSGNMWLDLTGAHRHHPLDHLVHLVVRLEQVDFWRLCDHFYGAASCWAGKGGLYEL